MIDLTHEVEMNTLKNIYEKLLAHKGCKVAAWLVLAEATRKDLEFKFYKKNGVTVHGSAF